MNKLLKTILIISIAVFSVSLLLANPTQANANGITITPEPIFEVDNFVPGQSVTTTVIITNNSGKNYERITLKGKAVTNEANFASALELKVGDLAEKNLGSLLTGDSLLLPNGINNDETRTFNFTMRFKNGGEADNQYQDKNLTFNFIFLFEGDGETGETVMGVFGGGGGRALLTIREGSVRIPEIGETSVTITWTTSYSSTSQVIYAAASEAYSFDLTKTNYGYPHAVPVPEDSTKVTFHSVTITGLTPGTTYYYRCVSHGSLAISREYRFTTKGVAGETIEEKPTEEIGIPEITGEAPEETTEEGIPSAPLIGEKKVLIPPESLLAALGMVIGQSAWKMIFIVLGLMGLIVVGAKEWKEAREKKKGKL